MKLRKLYLLVLILAASSSFADNYKHISQSLSADDFERLRLELTVGELAIEVWDEDTVEIDIELHAERSWLSWRRRNVEDIELDVEANGGELYVGITERKIEQHWSLKVPATLAMEIEMDVGEVTVKALQNSLALELGVGSITIDTDEVDFDKIEASVGVGDATLRGFGSNADNERSFVSAQAYYEGDGEHHIAIELGVGEVSIRR
ncbi:MAG: hypothetical protein ACI95C_000414 [Pseudohongiellaceae bacterium]|jgi:hypothetical protein